MALFGGQRRAAVKPRALAIAPPAHRQTLATGVIVDTGPARIVWQ